MKSFLSFLLLTLTPFVASAQLEWRISIKVFTDANGALPRVPFWGLGGATLYQELSNGVNYANAVLDAAGRGYRWRLTEIVNVAGGTAELPAATNSWFNLPVNGANQDDLDAKAKRNPAGFQYRDDAVNFYYVNQTSGANGGYCAFPAENQNVILVAPSSFGDVLIHESGHFFSLRHTFDTEAYQNTDGTACSSNCACAVWIGGDDAIGDTPLDHQCWNQNNVATSTYGRLYAQLNTGEQYFVDNTWSNIMSYHSPGNRFTSDQLDRMTDTSNGGRRNVASGRTWFVDLNSSCPNPTGSSFCALVFGGPFPTVTAGINAADNGDIVLIRAGNYNELRTFNSASGSVTLRATRGNVTIGLP